ncbi:hypothetical protein DSO57_1010105 [Entomophthora muscae]|uniref:Uncharacterized protein n=1 Tax=Entomophthora muscae TaxID=34485 RepID=A0ACC2U4F4_9FUNG|nr:hypothetical protein DSO57_1010105 [Entomophthora muscae]
MLTTFNLEHRTSPTCFKAEACESDASDDSVVPIPRDMDELVTLIREELGEFGLDSKHVDIDRIKKLMENYSSNCQDWQKYAHFDNSKYTRNLVDSGNGSFNLLVLAWGPGQASPIHDHAGSHCVMKILDGQLQESLYDWPEADNTPMHCTRTTNYQPNQVTYMHDKLGLHRVGNTTNANSLSLHLYTPPITHAITFQESTSQPRQAGTCTFYSVNGEKVNPCISQ